MTDPENKLDPELLQARWVLGGINPEELIDQITMALEQGLTGNALQQLAGFMRPTRRDLENLPDRAFEEMGLKPIDKIQAVTILLTRGEPPTSSTIKSLREAFPDFTPRWRTHIADWGGNPAGCYNDMAEFVYFVVEDLYERGKHTDLSRAFTLLEKLFVDGDQETKNLIAVGFFESLQNVASWRSYGKRVFEAFLPATSKQIWRAIERQWAGKSSLMDVIRAERQF